MRYLAIFLFCMLIIFTFWFKDNNTSPTIKIIEIKAPLMNTRYEKDMALDYLNSLRQHAGMPYYFANKLLDTAALSHAWYIIKNHTQGHYEIPSEVDFTGETPKQRILHTNYQVGMISENVTTNTPTYKDSIDGLFAAIYHRFGFLDFQTDEIGIGIAQDLDDTNRNAFVYDMGVYELNDLCTQKSYSGTASYVYHVCKDSNQRIRKDLFYQALRFKKSQIKKIVIYPYDGQKDIFPAFYEETPDPLPDFDVSGFPASIQFNDYYFKHIKLISFSLFGPSGKRIKSRILDKQNDPNLRFKKGQYALFPLQRLAYNTRYKVLVRYKLDEKTDEKIWHFTTRKLLKPFSIIQGNTGDIIIKPKVAYVVYFKPSNSHDILKNLHFPRDVSVVFIDHNTIKITLYSSNKSAFEITGGDKILHVRVD
jgi:hypothetical protein